MATRKIRTILDLNTNKITNLGTPTVASDASTKGYVDALAQGLSPKEGVRAATTAALPAVTYDNGTAGVGATLTADVDGALPAQDGVTLVNGNRFLVKNQAAGLQNGIYIVTDIGGVSDPFILTRADDFDDSSAIKDGSYFFINEGSTLEGQGWILTTNAPITVGTTALVFAQFNGAGSIVAGAALTKTGNTLDVNVDGSTIEISSDALRIKDLGVTFAKLAANAKPFVNDFASGDFTAGVYTLTGVTHGLGVNIDFEVEEDDGTNYVNVTGGVNVYSVKASGDIKIEVTSGQEFNGRLIVRKVS